VQRDIPVQEQGKVWIQGLGWVWGVKRDHLNLLSFTQMEFSFGTKKWVSKELMKEKESEDEEGVKLETDERDGYALGLHAPGFFDKVIHVQKCFLQSEPADKVINCLSLLHYTKYDDVLDLWCAY
jgi:hypothetical protein